jgi:cysteine-rich repeat protein
MHRIQLCGIAFATALIGNAEAAHAATLSPWAVTSPTNAGSAHNGLAGTNTHLYTVTQSGAAEIAPLNPDGSVGTWTVGTSVQFQRQYGTTHVAGTHLYITGGWQFPGGDPGAGGQETATVEVASINPDGSLGPWTYTTPMPFPRSNHVGVVAAGRLYVTGDYGGTTSVQSAAILGDGSLSAWRNEASTNLVRQRSGAAAIAGYLYVAGGLPFTLTVERAAIGAGGVLGPWGFVSSNLKQRYQMGMVAVGPTLFAIGGYNDTDGGYASVETATVSSGALGAWQFTSPMNQVRSDADATAVGNRLYVVGPYATTGVEYATVSGCGNGVVEAGEDCDDGNVDDGDCCSAACVVEVSNPGCDPDLDGDGVLDADEPCYCLGTLSGDVVTTVGCSPAQVCPCSAPLGRATWRSRSEYVKCVKGVARELLTGQRITLDERRTLLSAARASHCGD